jgi:hypothetical protein
VNDKDRDLIQEVLQAAGKAGEQGFSYLVHYQVVDGITGILASLACLSVLAYLFKRLLAWKPSGCDAYIAHVFRGLGMLAVSVASLIFICCAQGSLTQILAPEGAAIHTALGHR